MQILIKHGVAQQGAVRWRSGIAGVGAALVLAACGGGSGGGDAQTAAASTSITETNNAVAGSTTTNSTTTSSTQASSTTASRTTASSTQATSTTTSVSSQTVAAAVSQATAMTGDGAAATADDYAAALRMWRVTREKDACMSCHGPDFIDLARIGSTDTDLVRRAVLDGASVEEAAQLLKGVQYLRSKFAIKTTDARSFRPFQPGGVLTEGANRVEREVSFARSLERSLPTLMSSTPINSLSAALKARDEMLALDVRSQPIGIPLPLWSSDAHHAGEGTLDDWIADVPQVPRTGQEAEWIAVQDRYLQDPSDLNFWRLYFAADRLTQPFAGITAPASADDAGAVQDVQYSKFKSTLIGQHLLRREGDRSSTFAKGQIAFSYLTSTEPYATEFNGQTASDDPRRKLPQYLPNPMWELGDNARSSLGTFGSKDLARQHLLKLGYPGFVADSVPADSTIREMSNEMQLSWFLIGTLFDPGLQRINASNSSRVGEYFQGQLHAADYFIHRAYTTALRNVVSVYRAEATWREQPVYLLKFGYFTGYGRHMPTRWNSAEALAASASARNEQLAFYKRFTANFFRMSLFLHEQELDAGRITPYGGTTREKDMGDFGSLRDFFAKYADSGVEAADDALVRRVAGKARVTLP